MAISETSLLGKRGLGDICRERPQRGVGWVSCDKSRQGGKVWWQEDVHIHNRAANFRFYYIHLYSPQTVAQQEEKE